jgi:hypothetical protein
MVLGVGRKKEGLGVKCTDLLSNREETTIPDSMQLRLCPNDLFPLARICRQAQQRGEEDGSGGLYQTWFLGHGFSLSFGRPRSCPSIRS